MSTHIIHFHDDCGFTVLESHRLTALMYTQSRVIVKAPVYVFTLYFFFFFSNFIVHMK